MTQVPDAPDRMPRGRTDVDEEVLDGEAVVYDPRTGALHHLNATATAVWGLCDGETTVADAVRELADAFAAPAEQVRADVAALLGDLAERGLLEPGPPAGEPARWRPVDPPST